MVQLRFLFFLFFCIFVVNIQAASLVCRKEGIEGIDKEDKVAKSVLSLYSYTRTPKETVVYITLISSGEWANSLYLRSNFKSGTYPVKIATDELVSIQTLISNVVGDQYSETLLNNDIKILIDPAIRTSRYWRTLNIRSQRNVYDSATTAFSPRLGSSGIFNSLESNKQQMLGLDNNQLSPESRLARSQYKTRDARYKTFRAKQKSDLSETKTYQEDQHEINEFLRLQIKTGIQGSLTDFKQKTIILRSNLLLSGIVLKEDLSNWSDALMLFQRKKNLNLSERLNTKTEEAISLTASNKRKWLKAIGPYVFGKGKITVELSNWRHTNGKTKIGLLDKETEQLLNKEFISTLAPAKEILVELGYKVPFVDDPFIWQKVFKRFQKSEKLEGTGYLDESTKYWLLFLNATSKDIVKIVDTTQAKDWWAKSSLKEYTSPSIFDKEKDISFYKMSRAAAEKIRRKIEDTLGREVFTIIPRGQSKSVMVLTDTRGYGIHEDIRELLKIDRIGIGLSNEGGTSIFTFSEKGSQETFGKTAILRSSINGLDIEIIDTPTQNLWEKLHSWFGRSKPSNRQNRIMSEYLRTKVKESEFLIYYGEKDHQLQHLFKVPLIKITRSNKNSMEIKDDIQSALNINLDKNNTVIFNGLPKIEKDYQTLSAHSKLGGSWEQWMTAQSEVSAILKGSDFKTINSHGSSIVKQVKMALSEKANVIFVVAHSDGNKMFFPNRGKLEKITIDDLRKSKEKISSNKPIVVLLSCKTGSKIDESSSFAESLIELGAKMVIAPRLEISTAAANSILSSFLKSDGSSTLIEKLLNLPEDARDVAGDSLKVFVENSGAVNVIYFAKM